MIRRLVLSCLVLSLLVPALASAQVHVQGYTRRDGTYVEPHYRTYPDGNPYNNYSYRPRQGIDPSIPLAGRTPSFSMQPFFDAQRHRQEMELRQLEINERRRALGR